MEESGPTGQATPELRIRLLGEFEFEFEFGAEHGPVPVLESARAESLLAYLLLHPGPQPRQRLAFLLWPDSTEAQARTNLRHVLHNLRRALAGLDRYVEVTPRTLRWRPDAPAWLDVAAFEAALDHADGAAGTDVGTDAGPVPALREAVQLYRGDLLPGRYDEWLDGERQRVRGRFLAALRRLVGLLDARGEHADAVRYAEQLLRHDPLAEQTYQLLMRLHDAAGDRARALHVYHACAETLERELGAEPSAATRHRYEALLVAEGTAGAPPAGAAARAGRPPLVGRAGERARLSDAWRAAAGGGARLVLVTGEPGVGKTRLVEEFRSWCAHRGAVTAEAGAYPAEGTLAYGLIVSWLRSDPLAGHLRRLATAQLTELARLLPELLTERPGLARPQPLPEGELRQRLFDAVARAILASGAPVLLVADDLHWSDRESLRFLHYLLRVQPRARLLVAATARREDVTDRHALTELVAALEVSGRVVELPLDRFGPADTAVLARHVAGAELDEAARARLYQETEGNPLFVIETLRAGWHGTGGGRLSPRVQAVIESRLGKLSAPARDLVGIAATIGRAFDVDVLAEASGADEDTLVRGLDELWQRRIVREQGADAYDFTHGRIRDVVYGSLNPARRRRHHLRVAQALRRRYAADPGPVSGRLALHFEHAGVTDEAVHWYTRAAEAAQSLYAHVEAVRLLDHALDLLRTLPPGPERDARELALQTAVAAPLTVVEGFASPRLAAAHERALRLSGSLGLEPSPRLLPSLAVASLTRGDFARARELAADLRVLGDRRADGVLVVEAEYVLGIAEFWQGRFAAARQHFEAAVARYRPEDIDTYLLGYWLDPRVVCTSRLANTWWFLGRRGAAIAARDAALAWADEIGHPASRSAALVFAGLLSLELRDAAGVRAHAAALLAAAGEHESNATALTAQALAGYVEVLDGGPAAGIARIQRALDAVQAVDPAPGARASMLRVLLAAATACGDARTGLAAAERALAATDGVATWESETRRLRAEFLAVLDAPAAQVAAELDRALAVARRQGAPLFELRTATAMLRLAGPAAGPAAGRARDRLGRLVGRLDDAAGTPDLDDALVLLDPGSAPERPAERSRNALPANL
jgi:DNA-binding SARP family transcriptional activator